MKYVKRPERGRALFYSRDSEGQDRATLTQYVKWAMQYAAHHGLDFSGTPEAIRALFDADQPHNGDLYFDKDVKGHQMQRPALDALRDEIEQDPRVSHVLVPLRDRLSRPDDAVDGLNLERAIRKAGCWLVFQDTALAPLPPGSEADFADDLTAMIENREAGAFSRKLSKRVINAQISTARSGYWCGGRAPYGFARFAVGPGLSTPRRLQDGERAGRADHHVVVLPADDEKLAVVKRIVDRLLDGLSPSRVARMLTEEGVPTPNAGHTRTDNGITHETSSAWQPSSVRAIARNPVYAGILRFGRRAMGRLHRMTPEGPRPMTEEDFRDDQQPKVIAAEDAIEVEAAFDPAIAPERWRRLQQLLDSRSGKQKGTPRSRKPDENPLGCRVIHMPCGWIMYREPYSKTFRYTCGAYMQSAGATCAHDWVKGPEATAFVLHQIKRTVLGGDVLPEIIESLRRLAEAEQGDDAQRRRLASLQQQEREVSGKVHRAARNMTLADDDEQLAAMKETFAELKREHAAVQRRLREAEQAVSEVDIEAEVEAALSSFSSLEALAGDPENLGAIRDLFDQVNAKLFLDFETRMWGKREVRKVSSGVLTLGDEPAPVDIYTGRTAKQEVKQQRKVSNNRRSGAGGPSPRNSGGRDSLGKHGRGGRI